MRKLNPLVLGLALAAVVIAEVTNYDALTLDSDLIVGDDATVTDDLSVGGDAAVTGRLTASTIYPGGGCPNLASAGTLAVTESCHTLTGTTAVTNIGGAEFVAGDRLLLIFGGSITLTDGNDIILAGGNNFAAAAGDTVELIFDGADFFELSRSDNTP